MTDIAWGPSGQTVYERTYSRTKPDGSKETWHDTAQRVAAGNLALVYGRDELAWSDEVVAEYAELYEHIVRFKILPAGRHLWATGVPGRQYLMNCWTSGWGADLSDHFEFTFLRLMEGGGVGANYSSHFLEKFGGPLRALRVHIVCDPSHPNYEDMRDAGVLSTEFDSEWAGAYLVEDSREGWASALVDLIDTYMTTDTVQHVDRVYDVTNVRQKGARLRTFGGTASGPQPFAVMMHEVRRVLNATGGDPLTPMAAMEVDHAIAECVVSGGNRRSARMSIVRWDDPYVFDFIRCKSDMTKHWTTNISVEIDDQFLDDLDQGSRHASEVHREVVGAMLANGEPGYWNSSLSNEGELEPVYATNPCGEITLQPWEACNLGHVNLDAFAPAEVGNPVDYRGLARAHYLVTRFLIRATFADINDPKSREIQDKNRRIGVGHLGVQGFLNKQGIRYSEAPLLHNVVSLLESLKAIVDATAHDYAFQLRIPVPIKRTTVAPTGSVAKLPGVTEGIHPIYAPYFDRRIRFNLTDDDQFATVSDAIAQGLGFEVDSYDQSGNTGIVVYPTKDPLVAEVEALGYDAEIVESASEISLEDMLRFQAMYQSAWADNAVSFTVNVQPGLDAGYVAEVLETYLPVLKGTTIMVDETRTQAPYTRITREEYESAQVRTVEDSIDLECATGACPIR